ncbi:PP2C family protein-serine/threonine phosphatase [Actinoplanes sp. N902-109]|uniref:PP2C family protein-serine/threonine phosphatase n=1 Tax=Actinoplanes sp. (strain N902-109) TaxID=649831 RepID=UPI0003296140|nr:PP2C family protein-serine/threonine phosphatase [Actinoplanes sp. N902-109]AGL16853.1 serine phosphatase RsbU regulator of sigma subunit-like protein [Actinoplanes sp. N902-109]
MADEDVVRELLAAIPAGCTWLLPVTGPGDAVVDFRIAATSDQIHDIYGRGTQRLGGRLRELYPSMVGGPLWQLYLEVLRTGTTGTLDEFRFEESRPGVVAESRFEISVHRVLGGLLVWWHRIDEHRRRLERTELLGNLGWAEYELSTGRSQWSPGMYRIFQRDPADGPLPGTEQATVVLPEDRGIAETAWQTLYAGAPSDVTVRCRIGARVKHLRILSDLARDAAGQVVKVYAVAQDVTARIATRGTIERLSDEVRVRELSALAEHRLARQMQELIQPVPTGPFPLAGLQAMVSYLPAESPLQMGGDWYHAESLPDGRVALAVGDVAGHGMAAASGMAHLRFALTAWLSVGIRDPGLLLHHLNRLCGQLGSTATAVIGIYEPAIRLLRWARAGHMAPLLGRAGRDVDLGLPPGLLLGAEDDTRFAVADARLQPGDIVVLYTDGLVERRGDLARRGAEVLAHLRAVTAAPGGDPLPRLHRLLYAPNPDDDTCTVTVRVAASCGDQDRCRPG